MDIPSFAFTLVVVALPVVGFLALAAWLVERRASRVRIVDRHGRTLAEVVFGCSPGGV